MPSLPARVRMIDLKNEGARVFTRFLPLLVYGDFSRRSWAANSAVLGPIWPNFKLVRDVMDVLVTCKYEEDPIKNEGARVDTTLYSNFSVTMVTIGPLVAEILVFENVYGRTDGRTNGRTPDWPVYYKLTVSLRRPRCYIPSFMEIGLQVLEKIFEGFLPYMGMAAILVMWPGSC